MKDGSDSRKPEDVDDEGLQETVPGRRTGSSDETRITDPASHGTPVPRAHPERIGSYRIVAKLGEGGMGVVYEAEQQHPRRRVALKIIRGGQFVDDARVRMFQREADTLARLKHPNIAAIYESGRTEEGRHFFAMELVRGATLDAYLGERPPADAPRELDFRLGLFRKIVDAVHYAHQRGVIHRDLKPSNVVVTEETAPGDASSSGAALPEIKILDFGVARITEGDVAAATMATEIGAIKGTLAYMSPEQARGDPAEIDVRSDVYALGVILYEMLAGSRPYDVTRMSLIDAVHLVCEEPPAPLEQAWRGARRLDPDVATIVGKALEKEADRRYASAAALSEDVGRYLTSQPILARPPSAVYQLRKFARRNRALVGGVAATFLVLVAGAITSTVFGLREAAQRRVAERARADLESVVEFQAGMLSEVDPERMGRRLMEDLRGRVAEDLRGRGDSAGEVEAALDSFDDLTGGVNVTDAALRVVDEDILDRAGRTIEERFAERPLIAARLRGTIGSTYRELGLYERAEPGAALAVEIRERELGGDHPETLRARVDLAILYYRQGRYDEAEPMLLETLEFLRRVLGDDDPQTIDCIVALANLHYLRARYDRAEPLYLEALRAMGSLPGGDEVKAARVKSNLANLYKARGRYDEAEPLFLDALEIRTRVLGEDDPLALYSMNSLAGLYAAQGRLEEAESLYRRTLDTRERVLGDDHPETLAVKNNLANLLRSRGRYDEAERLFRDAIADYERVLGSDHPDTLRCMSNLASLHRARSRPDEAEPLLLETLSAQRRSLGDDHRDTLRTLMSLADLARHLRRPDDAESLYLEALSAQRRVLGDEHGDTLHAMTNLAELYRARGRYEEAEPLLLEALDTRRRVLGEDHPSTLDVMGHLALVYKARGRYEEAEPLLRSLLEVRKGASGYDDPGTLGVVNNLADMLMVQWRHAEAEPLLREAFAASGRLRDEDHPSVGILLHNLACVRREAGDHEESRSLFESAQALWEATLPPGHPFLAENLKQHAELLRRAGEDAEAVRLEARARAILEKR